MTAHDKAALIKNNLFSAVPSEFFEKRINIITAKKGEIVMAKNSFSRCLALIIKGQATVSKIGIDGKRTVINSLSEGDVFGMATLFYEDAEFPSEITAESSLRLAVFPKEIIEEAFSAYPEFAKGYAVLLSQKIHFLNKKIAAFSEGEASEKLYRWLTTVACGRNEFELSCSFSKLAQMLGISRASVYRAFSALEEQNIIKKDGKKIIIN